MISPSPRNGTRRPFSIRLVLATVALLGLSTEGIGHAQPEAPAEAAAEPPPPTWRWRKEDKPVKVVVLAGSIGAYKRNPYSQQLAGMCSNVEVRNISVTGLGAWALKKHFEHQVIGNDRLRWNVEGEEYWLVFGGGLNSVGNPRSNAHHMRRLFEMAHRRGMKVVGLTISPWGDDSDKRWRGLAGLGARRNTQQSVDFVMGRLDPTTALGNFAEKRRAGADAPWTPAELPDVGVDLYDSPLRNADAPLRDLDAMRALLTKDKKWQRAHAELDETQRQTKLEADAHQAAELPRWYLRPELRSFDHIHPNEDGHAIIAAEICAEVPASWGCTCPTPTAEATP